MIKKVAFLSLIALTLGFSSCETEFSLNGDYRLTPVVFGLLDHEDSVHVVKITKAFLGDDDNLVYAKIPDSNYFKTVDARIIEYNGPEKTGREWQLKDSVVSNKSTDGIFYAPEQKVYYFEEKELDEKMQYELVADLNEGALSIQAKTGLLSGFKMPGVFFSSFRIPFAKNTVVEDDDYVNWRFSVNAAVLSKTYELGYTFHWREYYEDGTTADFSATRRSQREEVENPENPGAFFGVINGRDFYNWVAETVPDDPRVLRRKSLGINVYVHAAHQELAQYMEVSQPVSGLAQIQPEFTNVSNGYGLFSSRLRFVSRRMRLNLSSLKELARGSITVTRLFCSDDPAHTTENFYCP